MPIKCVQIFMSAAKLSGRKDNNTLWIESAN
jgi:hypothetical protein